MKNDVRIAIAENHDYWRQILGDIIRIHIADAEIVFEASNGQQLVDWVSGIDIELAPTLILSDLHMPIMDGYETARWLQHNRPGIKVVTLSLMQNERSIIKLLGYGVRGFLHKNINGEDLIAGIQAVLDGEMYFSPYEHVSGDHVRFDMGSLQKIKEVLVKWDSLTKQEQELIRLCCTEMTYNEIAKKMRVVVSTLEQMISRIYKWFGVKNRIALILLMYKSKIL